MGGTGVIDSFLETFTSYIDSGFGLLGGEVGFLASTLAAIDITLAALFWSMGPDEDIIARLVKKTLFVGVFAYLIGNWNNLAKIIFQSFSGLGLKAAGSGLSAADFLQPGRVAQVGIDAGHPILTVISGLMGYVSFFENFLQIVVLLFAWFIILLSFFILAIQLFVTLIEFKLTTLAGFVLIPFGLFGKTAFLAERVLGNVVSSGVKVLVLAVIVGIGSTLFTQFTQGVGGAQPTIDNAMALVLAALSLLGLGMFGPGIANGIVSGGPQLGAGAAVGTGLVAAGVTVAGFGAARMAGGALAGLAGNRDTLAATTIPPGRGPGAPGGLGPASGPPPADPGGGPEGGAGAASEIAALARRRRCRSRKVGLIRPRRRRARLGAAHETRPIRRSRPVARRSFHPLRRLARRWSFHQPFRDALMFKRSSVRYGRTPEPETPYQKAAQVWDERIGSARAQAYNWRLIAFGNLFLAGGLAAALVWQAARGSVVPWVVQVDKLGEAQAVAAAVADYRPTDPQIAWHLARFIENVRSIPSDPIIVRQNWLKAYDFVTDKGALALNDYARANDPFAKIGQIQISVDVSSVIRASRDSFRIAWTERRYENASLASTERWTAILGIVVQPPRDAERLRKNPLGLFIHAINWSKELGE